MFDVKKFHEDCDKISQQLPGYIEHALENCWQETDEFRVTISEHTMHIWKHDSKASYAKPYNIEIWIANGGGNHIDLYHNESYILQIPDEARADITHAIEKAVRRCMGAETWKLSELPELKLGHNQVYMHRLTNYLINKHADTAQ